ncbi:type I toxin-antitoxin system Ibs family toxin [Escherichia fergusonii]|nr:type I toxin-antitoxin system Ibs family toxin [Escherichia fergusonii]MBZ4136207.1 type I toxin-antitoxin system Ibs family toxin [Escherichia fergusonii]MBZ4175351.1 type I toxin-antitoxin system Ibs family toxin [Escherichia fergusonii]UAW41146.1 type I toxin-antitoxin system Ibs family toxin [Escherichia fergusonii]
MMKLVIILIVLLLISFHA